MYITDFALSKATINVDSMFFNINAFKNLLSNQTKFMAVIKADAYSHGAVPLARKIEAEQAADYFAVGQLGEALQLRAEGIQTPILVFNSIPPQGIEHAIQENISLTVFSSRVAKEIVTVAERLQKVVKVHLKIDSGMARLGVRTFEEALNIYEQLQSDYVHVEGIYTHFADAQDSSPDNFTHEQFDRFNAILSRFEEENIVFDIRHCCNTAATINYPEYHLDMVRVGFGLYGLDPTSNNANNIQLKPIQTVATTVTHVKDFPAGESVGYLRTFFSSHPMRIATVAIGYADGVTKNLSNKGYFTYKGHRLPILGEICMDQIMLDVTEVKDIAVGDAVTYFGLQEEGHIGLMEVAEMANASPYDLLCRIGKRVKKVYTTKE